MDGQSSRVNAFVHRVTLCAAAFAGALLTFAHDANAKAFRVDPQSLDCERELSSGHWFGMVKDGLSTLEFENCFRVQNLAKLANTYSGRSAPQFYVDRIPASRMGQDAAVDIPVLRVVFPDRVFFDTGSAQLRVEAFEAVAIIAEALKSEPPDVTVFVSGHTDSRGDADANYNLSIARSEAVAKELARRRDIVANVWGIGFGEDMPLVANEDDWSWGQNRRVEFLFAGVPEAIAIWLADMQLDNLCVTRAGEDAERCKKQITLRSDYQAIEFVAPGPNPVMPSTAQRQTNTLSSSQAIAPQASQETSVDITRERRVINPVPGRRFKINPQRRSAEEQPSR